VCSTKKLNILVSNGNWVRTCSLYVWTNCRDSDIVETVVYDWILGITEEFFIDWEINIIL